MSLNLSLRGVEMKASRKKKNAQIKTRNSTKDGGLDPGGLTTKSWDHQRRLENNDLLYKSVAAPEDWKIVTLDPTPDHHVMLTTTERKFKL